MTRLQTFFAHAALLLGVVAFASSFARPTSGQQGATPAIPVNRYQSCAAGGSSPYVFVTDTVTGHTWVHNVSAAVGWEDFGTPPRAK